MKGGTYRNQTEISNACFWCFETLVVRHGQELNFA